MKLEFNIELNFNEQLVPVDADLKNDYKIKNIDELLLQLQSLREEANYMIKCRLRESIWYRDRNALDIIIKALHKSILKEKK